MRVLIQITTYMQQNMQQECIPLKKVFIKTYGCQMNVYDSLKMEELLKENGYIKTEELEDADLCILNTCHIREKASEKVYSELGRIKQIQQKRIKSNLGKMIITVAGCVGQAEGEEIFARAPFVDIVVGPQSYSSLPELIAKKIRNEKHLIDLDFIEEEKFDKLNCEVESQGVSAFISVQEGCDKFCTFCVVPYTRGAEFSRPMQQVYNEALSYVSKGATEIYLLGQNVNAYHGQDPKGNTSTLADLIKQIAIIPEVQRIRYTTSHPLDMADDLIELHGMEPKLMPFLHLPVQSGSNTILNKMNRKHTREKYFEIIDKLRNAKPDIVFSSDFIVGFPEETDQDFEDTLDLVKKVKFGQCYSFKYSPRPGTPAATRPQIPEHIKSERLAILQQALNTQQMQFNQSCIGQIMPVLFQKEGKLQNQFIGKTQYMQSVYLTYDTTSDAQETTQKILNVKITQAFATSLTGEIVK